MLFALFMRLCLDLGTLLLRVFLKNLFLHLRDVRLGLTKLWCLDIFLLVLVIIILVGFMNFKRFLQVLLSLVTFMLNFTNGRIICSRVVVGCFVV
jgi:hypothetical protein